MDRNRERKLDRDLLLEIVRELLLVTQFNHATSVNSNQRTNRGVHEKGLRSVHCLSSISIYPSKTISWGNTFQETRCISTLMREEKKSVYFSGQF